ncbi:hypothetical protein HY932_02725 [Candidatus Falkowbacteria bacterium]|nr:hypothetical protein [Candidatus Falkowbacteria bacterium]
MRVLLIGRHLATTLGALEVTRRERWSLGSQHSIQSGKGQKLLHASTAEATASRASADLRKEAMRIITRQGHAARRS